MVCGIYCSREDNDKNWMVRDEAFAQERVYPMMKVDDICRKNLTISPNTWPPLAWTMRYYMVLPKPPEFGVPHF